MMATISSRRVFGPRERRDGDETEAMRSPAEVRALVSTAHSGALIRELERRGYRVFPAARIDTQGRFHMIALTADEMNRRAATPQWKGRG